MRTVIAAAFLLFSASAALATGAVVSIITAEDRARLDEFDAVRAGALADARSGGAREDLAALDAALAGEPLAFQGFDPVGAWRCRVIKLGGGLPLVAYPWFNCRIKDDGAGWFMEKTSGSQRTSGRLYDDGDKRLLYLGAGTVNDDAKRVYNADPLYNEPAYVERLGPRKLVFQFPSPKFESKFDMLVLERR
jgi:Domain of unknown function (DUF4893)